MIINKIMLELKNLYKMRYYNKTVIKMIDGKINIDWDTFYFWNIIKKS